MAPSDRTSNVRDIATAWQPQRPGRRSPKDVVNALIEPDWGGARVVAALTADGATLHRDGQRLRVPAVLEQELAAAFTAVDAVVEGHLTPKALEDGSGHETPMPRVERPPLFIPRGLFGRGRRAAQDDPYILARDQQAREDAALAEVLDAMRDGEDHAFVATDLLHLDGTDCRDLPLAERKRLLDTLLTPSSLVRVTPYVKPAAQRMLMTWGEQGFAEVHWRAANSRYTQGAENPDWVVSHPPGRQQAPSGGPLSRG